MYIKTLHNYSPNFSTTRRNRKKVKYIVYHYTGMRSESKAIKRLTDVKSKVSCHYFIKKNGKIILIVPELFEAWHAGKSYWKNDESLNKSSIGIEISISSPFTLPAIAALANPGPIASAISFNVTAFSNSFLLPSGSVIIGMIKFLPLCCV